MTSHYPKVNPQILYMLLCQSFSAPSTFNHLSYYPYANTLYLATVQKIITEILTTPGVTFARDARDLLIDCCVEFITLISSEANEIAEKEAKKTIAPDHIDKALRELGFPEYVQEVLTVAGEHKEQLKVRPSLLRCDLVTIT